MIEIAVSTAPFDLGAKRTDYERAGVNVSRVQGRALRWEALDEDIWVGDVLAGRFPK